MYRAIVFLPLLGSILAALITLTGARGRHPVGSRAVAHRHEPPLANDVPGVHAHDAAKQLPAAG